MKLPTGFSIRWSSAAVEELKEINDTLDKFGHRTGAPGVGYLVQDTVRVRYENQELRRRVREQETHIRMLTEELAGFRRTTVRISPDSEPTPLEQAARRETGIDLGLTTRNPVIPDFDETRQDRILSAVDYPDTEPREFPVVKSSGDYPEITSDESRY